MRTEFDLKKIAIVITAILIVSYSLFEARKLIAGPEVVITSPANGAATSSQTVTITGRAQNISFLTIDDAPAYTDESGTFSETLSAPAGYTVITVAAVDRFGRRESKSVAIDVLDYCPV